MKELDEIISLLKNNNISDFQSAIHKISSAFAELRNIKYALDQSAIVAITDDKGVITYANDKFCEISRYSREELIGRTHRIINSGYHNKEYFRDMWQTIRSGKVWEGEIRNRAKDGKFYWVKTTIVPFSDEHGVPKQYIAIRTEITRQKTIEEQVRRMALFDELTGLANRRLLQETLEDLIERRKTPKIAVIFLDLNRFSMINDTLGHAAGDEILKETGKRLKQWEEQSHALLAARFGGDEFVLVCTGENMHQLRDELRNIRALIAEPYYLGQEEYRLSSSMGVALYPQDGATSGELIRHADMAMYRAKSMEAGFLFYYEEYNNRISREMLLERLLHKAVEEESFDIHYQPKVDLRTGKMSGTEALIRWNHPELGTISPSEFIPVAERSRLIIPLGSWMLRKAMEQNMKWLSEFNQSLIVAVNVSPVQVNQRNFVNVVRQILQDTGMPPELLELEITENVAMENERDVLEKLRALKQMGIKISLDDFGTGYSSLKYLRAYEMDTLKIDRTFIHDYEPDHADASLIPGMIAIGHALGMRIVAEGVETREQLEFLKANGCDTVQGYVFSRPLPPAEVELLFDKQLHIAS